MSSELLIRTELKLASLVQRKHCVLVGRGASAIYLALRVLGCGGGKVVVPSLTCPSPATVCLYAGFEPIFCDVVREGFTMDPSSLEKVLGDCRDVRAVMPIHLYGRSAPMDEICNIAQKWGVPVIEDAAQALGGEYGSAKLGSLGDMSILSFGHTKILDVGWGGAVLTDSDEYAENLRKERESLPGCPENINSFYEDYRDAYYSIKKLADRNPKFEQLFHSFPEIFRPMYLFQIPDERVKDIEDAIQFLSERVDIRRQNAKRYAERLAHSAVYFPDPDPGAVPWRFNFLVEHSMQEPITERLRDEGIDASNWYPPIHNWYPSGAGQGDSFFPQSIQISKQIVNLWVSEEVSESQIERTCEIILKKLNE